MSRAASTIPTPPTDSPTSPSSSSPTTTSSSVSVSGLPDVSATGDFASAADAVLLHLQRVAPLTLWAVVRYDEGDCVFDAVAGSDSDGAADVLAPGTRMPWGNLLCARMVEGRGPRVAPDVRRVAAYAAAPLARRLPVGAYVGVPVRLPDGTLVGTICGLDPSPLDAAAAQQLDALLPVLEVFATMLGRLRAVGVALEQAERRAARAERRAVTDALTGITNRLGWDEALAGEQARASRRGLWTGLVAVDLDDLKVTNDRDGHEAGDGLLQAAAESLQAVVRREDVLARVGGDEFAVLVSDCDGECLDMLIRRLRQVLDSVGVRAAIGAVSVGPGTALREAWKLADLQMYAEKHGYAHRQLNLDLSEGALRTG